MTTQQEQMFQCAIFSVDGNIGSGKSTLVRTLKSYYENDFDKNKLECWKDYEGIIFIQEPVDIWMTIQDNEGETILSKFYKDSKKYAFSFQMMAYISRIHILKEAVRKHPNHIIITERCVETDRYVFAKMLYDDGKIEEVNYNIYLMWFDEFIKDIPIRGHIYVNTDPLVCEERIKKRNRDGEAIPLTYLENCHKYHEEWLNNTSPVYIVNGNVDNTTTNHVDIKTSVISWLNEEGWENMVDSE